MRGMGWNDIRGASGTLRPSGRQLVVEWLPLLMIVPGLFVGLELLRYFDWGYGRERAMVVLLLAIWVGTLTVQRSLRAITSTWSTGVLALLFLICVYIHVAQAAHYVEHGLGLIDVATLTQDANGYLLQGHNPYTLHIDRQWPRPQYQGYKYSPLMLFIFLPARFLGIHGVFFTNALLNLTLAFFLLLLCRRHVGLGLGFVAASLYLTSPLVLFESYSVGVNDMTGMVFVLGALLCIHRPVWAGLLLGLSLSCKLMPGVLVGVALVRRRGFLRYIAGGLLGCLPIVVFLYLSPKAFLDNVLFFPISRIIDSTSWLYGKSATLIRWVKYAFVGVGVLSLGLALLLKLRTSTRVLLTFFLTTASLFNSAAVHRNYFVWWYPLLLLALFLGAYKPLPPSPDEEAAV